MELGSLFIIISLIILTIIFIIRPFYDPPAANASEYEKDISRLLSERNRLLNQIRDLDYDYSMQKVPEEEYKQLRDALVHQGGQILQQIEKLRIRSSQSVPAENDGSTESPSDPLFDNLEAIIAERRRQKEEKSVGFCSQCGSPILKSDIYCSRCGIKII